MAHITQAQVLRAGIGATKGHHTIFPAHAFMWPNRLFVAGDVDLNHFVFAQFVDKSDVHDVHHLDWDTAMVWNTKLGAIANELWYARTDRAHGSWDTYRAMHGYTSDSFSTTIWSVVAPLMQKHGLGMRGLPEHPIGESRSPVWNAFEGEPDPILEDDGEVTFSTPAMLLSIMDARLPRTRQKFFDYVVKVVGHILRSNAGVVKTPFMLYDFTTGVWVEEVPKDSNGIRDNVYTIVLNQVFFAAVQAYERMYDFMSYLVHAAAPLAGELATKEERKGALVRHEALREQYHLNERAKFKKRFHTDDEATFIRTLRERLKSDATLWDSNMRYVVLKDCAVDVEDVYRNGRISALDFDPEHFSTHSLDITRDDLVHAAENLGNSEFAQGVEKVLPDRELREYLQMRLGAALLGRPEEDKSMLVLYGQSNTAKSSILACVASSKGVFSAYSKTTSVNSFVLRKGAGSMGADERMKAGARGKRFLTTSEPNASDILNTSVIKEVTGGEDTAGTAKYENEVTYPFTATVFMTANSVPSFGESEGGDVAAAQRVVVLPFTHRLWDRTKHPAEWARASEEERADPHWVSRILASPRERAAVAAWVFVGLKEYGIRRRAGTFTLPVASLESAAAVAEDMDPITWAVRVLLGEDEEHTDRKRFEILSPGEWGARVEMGQEAMPVRTAQYFASRALWGLLEEEKHFVSGTADLTKTTWNRIAKSLEGRGAMRKVVRLASEGGKPVKCFIRMVYEDGSVSAGGGAVT